MPEPQSLPIKPSRITPAPLTILQMSRGAISMDSNRVIFNKLDCTNPRTAFVAANANLHLKKVFIEVASRTAWVVVCLIPALHALIAVRSRFEFAVLRIARYVNAFTRYELRVTHSAPPLGVVCVDVDLIALSPPSHASDGHSWASLPT